MYKAAVAQQANLVCLSAHRVLSVLLRAAHCSSLHTKAPQHVTHSIRCKNAHSTLRANHEQAPDRANSADEQGKLLLLRARKGALS
jgi:hypothetical protein